jgi:hypothetical protein
MKRTLTTEADKRKKLKHSQLFVLDNSLRESTVGQLRGHTLENKWKIYEEVITDLSINNLDSATHCSSVEKERHG